MNKTMINNDLRTLGFWSALLSGLLAVAWNAAFAYQFITFPMQPLVDLEAYARSYSFLKMINLVPALLLTWPFVVMMVCVHFLAPVEKKVWTMTALAFTIIYAVMANINYLIQLVAVGPSLQAGQTEGLLIFVGDNNPSSVFWALANAYALQTMGLFFAAHAFQSGLLERWIRWTWLFAGATTPFQFAFSLQMIPMTMALPVLVVWMVGIPLSCFLLAVRFRRASQPGLSQDTLAATGQPD